MSHSVTLGYWTLHIVLASHIAKANIAWQLMRRRAVCGKRPNKTYPNTESVAAGLHLVNSTLLHQKQEKEGGKKNNVTLKKSKDVCHVMYATYTSHPLLLSVPSFALFSTSSPASHSKGLRNITRSLHVWKLLEKVCETSVYCVHYISSHFSVRRGGARAVCAKCSKIFCYSTKLSSEFSAINIRHDHKKSEQKIVLFRRCWVSTYPNLVFCL